jgi:uncharacterized membrane protein (DUF485 family)
LNSSPNDKSLSETIEDVISANAETVSKDSAAPAELGARLDKLEVLIEQLGQTTKLVANFSDYVGDLRADLRALRRTRFWMILFAIVFVFGADLSVLILIFHHGQWFALQETSFKSITFATTLTASVVLISIMLKGAFHSLAERNKDDGGLPPHLKEGMDLIKMLTGK